MFNKGKKHFRRRKRGPCITSTAQPLFTAVFKPSDSLTQSKETLKNEHSRHKLKNKNITSTPQKHTAASPAQNAPGCLAVSSRCSPGLRADVGHARTSPGDVFNCLLYFCSFNPRNLPKELPHFLCKVATFYYAWSWIMWFSPLNYEIMLVLC